MSQPKRVFSGPAFKETVNNSRSIRRLIKRCRAEEQLKKGYCEAAGINITLAEMCFSADNEELRQYEEKLTECE